VVDRLDVPPVNTINDILSSSRWSSKCVKSFQMLSTPSSAPSSSCHDPFRFHCIPCLFDTILNTLNNEGRELQTQVLTVLRAVMASSLQFESDRQIALVNGLAPRLGRGIKQSPDVESLLFNLDLLTHIQEFLTLRFDASHKIQVLEPMKAQLKLKHAEVSWTDLPFTSFLICASHFPYLPFTFFFFSHHFFAYLRFTFYLLSVHYLIFLR
jgi:hypothetical protein